MTKEGEVNQDPNSAANVKLGIPDRALMEAALARDAQARIETPDNSLIQRFTLKPEDFNKRLMINTAAVVESWRRGE